MSRAPRAADLERFRELVALRLGLYFDGCRLGQLEQTLAERIESTGTPAAVYLDRLQDPQAGAEEMRSLAAQLTVSETYFFRNNDQFRAFSELVLPEVMRARSAERRLRILSAGCASGEEAYTLAILVSELAATAGWEIAIHGIDVSSAALARAAAGRYSTWSLRETPAEVRERCFRPAGRDFLLDPALRARASFGERNLTLEDDSFWAEGSFDVVFCRNVLMYFSPDTAKAVVARLARSLAPGGFLFLGHAETLRGLSQDFHLRHTHDTFYYQRRLASEEVPHDAVLATLAGTETHLAPAALDDSWVDTIRHASEHIRSLTGPSGDDRRTAPAGAFGGGKPAWNLAAAAELVGRERFSEARSLLDALPAESTHDPDVLLLKAVLLTHGGDLVQAEQVCLRLLELDELSAGAHYLTALCREDAGDADGACHHDQVASYLDPSFAMPRLHLGLLARRAARPDTARRELEHALLLLEREEASRLLLFGGGFSRDALAAVCRAELLSCGGRA